MAHAVLQGTGCAAWYWLCCMVQAVLQGTGCAARYRLCFKVQALQQGTGYAARYRLYCKVQAVLEGTGCAARYRLCCKVQAVLQGTGCAARYRLCCKVHAAYYASVSKQRPGTRPSPDHRSRILMVVTDGLTLGPLQDTGINIARGSKLRPSSAMSRVPLADHTKLTSRVKDKTKWGPVLQIEQLEYRAKYRIQERPT